MMLLKTEDTAVSPLHSGGTDTWDIEFLLLSHSQGCQSDSHYETGAFAVEHTRMTSITITLVILVIESHSAFDPESEEKKPMFYFFPQETSGIIGFTVF